MCVVLVTGGAGFIGANFVRYWIDKYPQDRVVVIDALTYAGNLDNLATIQSSPNFRFVRGDICDTELVRQVLSEESVNRIFHFAAESHVDRSILGPQQFVQTNVVGTLSMLEAARSAWLGVESSVRDHRFHHVSTDEVYGSLGPDDPAFSESTAYSPNSPYSASKAGSDHLVRAYHHTYGLKVTMSNCSNNYGPLQFPEKLIPLMIVNCLDGKPLPIYGDGSNIRDWLHVQDHVRAIDLVAAKGKIGETYNVGGNDEKTNIEIVDLICKEIDDLFANDGALTQRFPDAPPSRGKNSSSLIEFVSDRPGHDWRYAIDARRIESELGFTPAFSFFSGLEATVAWMLDNEDWWRAIQDDSYRAYVQDQYSGRSIGGGS